VTERRRISSGGPWEASTGYSRAIVDGDSCWVAGTTDAGPDGTSAHPGDAARQAAAAWEIVRRALEAGGFSLEDVVRTRMYVVSAEDVTAVSAVHGSVFGGVRPAATLVQVAGLIDPSLLIEVEADARRRARGRLRWSGEPDRAAAGRDGDGDDQAE
jgi:enamine deaminase RidA (YjgF/YER057c/UK114 family)